MMGQSTYRVVREVHGHHRGVLDYVNRFCFYTLNLGMRRAGICKMADALMKWETIDKAQIDDLMAGRDPRPPADDNDTTGKTNIQKPDKGDDSSVGVNKPVGQV